METSLKTVFDKIFSCCPKNLSCPKFEEGGGGAAAPLAPPARPPMVFHSKGLTVFWKFELHDYSW